MRLSRSVPVSLRCQQASEQQCWAAESARNLPCSFTGPASKGPTRPLSPEHLRSLRRGPGSAAEEAGAQGGDREQSWERPQGPQVPACGNLPISCRCSARFHGELSDEDKKR